MMKRHHSTCSLIKGFEPETDQVSGSNCQFAGNTEDKGMLSFTVSMRSTKPRLRKTIPKINCQEEKKGDRGRIYRI